MMEQTRFFNEAVETLAPDRLLDLQWERLQERLDYLGRHSPFYQRKFAQTDLKPSEIKDLDDFRQRVPFTVKDEIKAVREADRDGFGGLLCVPRDRIVHLVRTGGATGLPTMYAVTENDLRTMGELTARLWYQIGARPGHTVPIGTFGSWNAFALAVLEGLRTAGLTRYHFSMPAPGEEVFPLEVLPQWLEVHGLYLSPRPLLNVTVKYGLRLKEMLPHLEYMLMAGQHVTPAFRRGIEERWGGRLFEAYPMTDVGLNSINCSERTDTFHFAGDAFFVEVIDPETGEDLSGTGRIGEIVVSALLWEGTPLLRFRSGDMGWTTSDSCPCGRTGPRLGIAERVDHAVQIGDRTLFSSEIEDVLYDMPELFLKQYHLVRKMPQPQAKALVRVEQPDDPSIMESLRRRIQAEVGDRLGLEAEIEFMAEGHEKFVAAYKFLRVVTE